MKSLKRRCSKTFHNSQNLEPTYEPKTDEQTKKLWHTYTMLSSFRKKNEVMKFASDMDRHEGIMQSEMFQRERDRQTDRYDHTYLQDIRKLQYENDTQTQQK